MRDVATLAGVDVSAVSRLVSGDPNLRVSDETRRRIEEAVSRLDYVPNPVARSLRTRRTGSIALLIPDVANPVFAQLTAGAQRRATELGYALVLAPPADEPDGSIRTIGRLLLRGRVDGLLIATARTHDPAIQELERSGLPIVLVNRRSDSGLPQILVDDAAGAELGTGHLIELGHRSIAHLEGDADAETTERRRLGYLRAMASAGLEPWLVPTGFNEAAGYAAALALLRAGRRPTAIFCSNTRAAFGALAACYEAGVAVPRELSLVGLHDLPLARYSQPPLTVVNMPIAELGTRAVEALARLIRGESVGSQVLEELPHLIERGSSGPPPA